MEEGLIGAEVTCQPAVTDGHITTSRGLGTAIDFALALISELRDKESADTISKQVVKSSTARNTLPAFLFFQKLPFIDYLL